MTDQQGHQKNFGTAPVFFTAISTILGAILFLRFGYAVGTLGFGRNVEAGLILMRKGHGQYIQWYRLLEHQFLPQKFLNIV